MTEVQPKPLIITIPKDFRTLAVIFLSVSMILALIASAGYVIGTQSVLNKTYLTNNQPSHDSFFSGVNYAFNCAGCHIQFDPHKPVATNEQFSMQLRNLSSDQTYIFTNNFATYILTAFNRSNPATYMLLFGPYRALASMRFYLFQYIGNSTATNILDFNSVYTFQNVILIDFITFQLV